jgi:hypothetical protein
VPGDTIELRLDPARKTFGGMEETAQNSAGTLDVPPFGLGSVDSFFDVFFEIEGDFGAGRTTLVGATSKRIDALLFTKPPTDEPHIDGGVPVVLLAGGAPTDFTVVNAIHIARPPIDFGDAPDPLSTTAGEYPTLAVNDGARHMIPSSMPGPAWIPPFFAGPRLGPSVGGEPDGQPTAAADGDDKNVLYDDGVAYPNGDETAVTFAANLFRLDNAAATGTVTVDVQNAPGILDAWIDFDQDGRFDPADKIIGQPVTVGTHSISFTIPAGTTTGLTYARFRISSLGTPNPTGLALDGEVEDYTVTIQDATTDVLIDGSFDLQIIDTDGGDTNDTLTLARLGANVRVTDPANVLEAGNGATQIDAHTVDVPLGSITGGDILVDTLGGDDSLTVDLGGAALGLPVAYHGGTNGAAGDTLSLTGGAFTAATYNFTNANDGDMDFDGRVITYTGLEPISSTIAAADVTLNYSAATETITVSDAGGGKTQVDSTAGEFINFDNPTNSLTVNAGGGNDTINVEGLGSGSSADLIIDGQGDADLVSFQANSTDTGGGDLTVTADTVNLAAAVSTGGGDVSLSATGDITLNGAVTTGGGCFTADADSEHNGSGKFSLTDAVLAVFSQQSKLTASDAAADDWFGNSVSVSGDTAIIGAYVDDDAGSQSGSAYVFTRSGDTWIQQAKLTASDATAYDQFGVRVSLDGDTAIVGAFLDDDAGSRSGSAYVFVRSGTIWTQQAKLTASDAAAGDYFGVWVSVDGDTAIVGAQYNDDNGTNSGSAYVFTRSGGTWSEQAKLTASDAAAEDHFGHSVAFSGDTAIVGAQYNDDNGTNSGSAYVFTRSGGTWSEQAKLTASDAAAEDHFGHCVSFNGDTAIVGAYANDDNGTNSGSAYVFTRSGGTWSEQAKLIASDAAAEDYFGSSVSVDGDTAIVGAQYNDDHGTNSGSAYVFTRSGGTWSEQGKLTASDAAAEDYFGRSVSVDGDTVILGANFDDDGGTNSGSAYVFQRSPASISTGGGVVSITAADAEIGGTIDAAAGPVSFLPSTLGRTFDLGATGGTGQFVLTDAELDNVATTAKIVVGNSITGDVTITGATSPANADTLEIISDATIGDTNTSTPDVTIAQLTLDGNVNPGTSPGILSVDGNFTFAVGDTFTVEIDGTTPGTGYDQLSVLGNARTITLNNAELAITLTTPPAVGSQVVYTIVDAVHDNSTRIGLFNYGGSPLNNGDEITVAGTELTIHYLAGGDVTLTESGNQPPTIAADNAAVTTNEGTDATNTGTFSDPQGNHTVTISADVGTVTQNDTLGTWSWSIPAPDGPFGPVTVTITATDDVGAWAETTFTYSVENVPPELVDVSVTSPIDENDEVTLRARLVDPGCDDMLLTIDWGDPLSPDNTQTFTLGTTVLTQAADGIDWDPATSQVSVDHQYLDDNPSGTGSDNYTINLSLNDDDHVTVGSWATQSSMTTGRTALDVGVVDGTLYAVGGSYFSTFLSSVEAYDPASDTWTAKASMPTARSGLAAGVVDDILYAVGGAVGPTNFGTLEAYDPATDSWTTKAPMPTARRHLDVGVVNGILYAVGGYSNSTGYETVVEAYDPATDTWTTKSPMPTGRRFLGVDVIDGILYAVGGEEPGGGAAGIGAVEAYDPATDTWTTKTSMLTPRGALAVGVVDGILYAAGGNTTASSGVAIVEAYDPASDTWTSDVPMPTARDLAAGKGFDGRLFVVGGRNPSGSLNVVEALTPDTPDATASVMVTVENVPPTATLGNDGPQDEGTAVTVSFSNQMDPGTLDSFLYSFDWENDGIYDVVDQASASATYTWYSPGMYTVRGKIADDDGGLNEYTTDVTILPTNTPPTTSGIDNVEVVEDADDTVINLFAAFDDEQDPDEALTYEITSNSNPDLFTSVTIDGEAGTLTLDYAPDTTGTTQITVQATDLGGLFVDTMFTVTVIGAEEQIEDLVDVVEELKDTGVLGNGEANPALNFLDQALDALRHPNGKSEHAIHKLNQFIDHVERLVPDTLTPEEAQPLIDAANAAITAILPGSPSLAFELAGYRGVGTGTDMDARPSPGENPLLNESAGVPSTLGPRSCGAMTHLFERSMHTLDVGLRRLATHDQALLSVLDEEDTTVAIVAEAETAADAAIADLALEHAESDAFLTSPDDALVDNLLTAAAGKAHGKGKH